MIRGLPVLCLIGAAAAFASAAAVLAAMGLGASFLAAAIVMAGLVALVLYGAGRVLLRPAPLPPPPGPTLEERIRVMEDSTMRLRHDLRGVLSPAMLMTDRLLRNEDPAIRRAGQAVVRSIERATALLAENKIQASAAARDAAGAADSPPRSLAAESAGRSP